MIQQQLVASLFALALVSLASAVVGLYARPRDFWRAFWFMGGLWGAIDGGIAWVSLVSEPMSAAELHRILGLNLTLQAVYLPIGVALATRRRAPNLSGFGASILVQALALAAIDTVFYWETAAAQTK